MKDGFKKLMSAVVVTMMVFLSASIVFGATTTYDGYEEISQNAADDNTSQGPNWFAQEKSDWTDLNEDGNGDWVNLPYIEWGTHFVHWSGGTSPQIGNNGSNLAIAAGEHTEPANEAGAVMFVVPEDGMLKLYAKDTVPNFEVLFPNNIQAPINVQILKNDVVLWPENETGWHELSPQNPTVSFPTINVEVNKDDMIRIVAQGAPANSWQNHVTFYPLIDLTTQDEVSPSPEVTATPTSTTSSEVTTSDDSSPETGDPIVLTVALGLITGAGVLIKRKRL